MIFLLAPVVVRKSLRGKGYGRILMDKTERFAARLVIFSIDWALFHNFIGHDLKKK